jgi:hypothetical protein
MAMKRQSAPIPIFLILLFSLCPSMCIADEVLFKNQKASQTGVVVQEDPQSVTIRFPRDEIQSITGNGNKGAAPYSDKVIWEEEKDYIVLKIPRSSIMSQTQQGRQMEGNEAGPEVPSEKAVESGSSKIYEPKVDMSEEQKLLAEEMGRVEGVILWRDKPLQEGKVKIILEKYTGYSAAALKKRYITEKNSSADEIVLETKADSNGRYIFNEAPPGFYRLYWMPENGTDWIHRLRESPDFEVVSGTVTTENIPEKKK